MTRSQIDLKAKKNQLLRSRDPRKKIWGGIFFIFFIYLMTLTQYLMTVIQFMASMDPKMEEKAL